MEQKYLAPHIIKFFREQNIPVKNMSKKVGKMKDLTKILEDTDSNVAFVIRQHQTNIKEQKAYRAFLKHNMDIKTKIPITTICYKSNHWSFCYDKKVEKEHTYEYMKRTYTEKVELCPICMDKHIDGKYNPITCERCCSQICCDCFQKMKKMECPCCRMKYMDMKSTHLHKMLAKRKMKTCIRIDNPAVASVVFNLLRTNFPDFNINLQSTQ